MGPLLGVGTVATPTVGGVTEAVSSPGVLPSQPREALGTGISSGQMCSKLDNRTPQRGQGHVEFRNRRTTLTTFKPMPSVWDFHASSSNANDLELV